MPQLYLDYPYWFLIICISIAAIYAYTLYTKKHPWSKGINKLLALLRFVLVSFLLFLLLNPLWKQFVNEIENPVFVIGIDNSTSMLNSLDTTELSNILNQLDTLGSKFEDRQFEVEFRTLNQSDIDIHSVSFDQKSTDVNAFFKNIQGEYESRNLAAVILASDGNYNTGISPAYFPYPFEIYTLGIGDTSLREDIILKNVLSNKLAYQGNKFPVIAEVVNQGFEGKKATISIRKGNKIIAKKELTFDNAQGFRRVEFEVLADKKGINHYVVEVISKTEEAITSNNKQDVFIDVIDGKQKILIIAPAPHPDIKALQSVIGNNENYELDIFIPNVNKLSDKPYDLIIAHQYYDRFNITKKYIEDFKAKKTPVLHILGQQSNKILASNKDPNFTVKQIRHQSDKVVPAFNSDFAKFTFSSDYNQALSQYPSIEVPYGDFQLTPDMSVILYQQVGSIVTNKPILYVKESEQVKNAYFIGDGFWRWRLQEYAVNENTKAFDELFSKLIQYLSTKADKRKLRVNASKSEFYDNEPILIATEVYNDIYEKIYGDNIQLQLTNQKGFEKAYSFTAAQSSFEISGLTQGVYSYRAIISDKKLVSTGSFIVKNLQLETLDQSADFSLLRQISSNTNGKFYSISDFNLMNAQLQSIEAQGIIHSEEDFFALINLRFLFFVLLALVSTEWFVRRYSGGY